MPTIFVDESGDLGFRSSSSRIFVIAGVCFADTRSADLLVKHARSRHLPRIGTEELKWNKSSPEFRGKFLRLVGSADVDIAHASILWKDRVSPALQNNPPGLYNYLAYQAIRWLANRRRGQACAVILDRSIYGFQQNDISRYLESDGFKAVRDEWAGKLDLVPKSMNLALSHENSSAVKGLQIADFIAGSIYHYYESDRKDRTFFQHIDSRMCGEYLFPTNRG